MVTASLHVNEQYVPMINNNPIVLRHRIRRNINLKNMYKN